MKYKNILIVAMGDTGNEPEALRQVLENLGYFVMMYYVGRPNDFRKVLRGEFPFQADCIILSCHGEDGGFVAPILGEDVYEKDEIRGNYMPADVVADLQIKNKLIISLGCTTGQEEMSKAFGKDNLYIAPVDYVQGGAALFFAVKLFYELKRKENQIKEGSFEQIFKLAKETDDETRLFTLSSSLYPID